MVLLWYFCGTFSLIYFLRLFWRHNRIEHPRKPLYTKFQPNPSNCKKVINNLKHLKVSRHPKCSPASLPPLIFFQISLKKFSKKKFSIFFQKNFWGGAWPHSASRKNNFVQKKFAREAQGSWGAKLGTGRIIIRY